MAVADTGRGASDAPWRLLSEEIQVFDTNDLLIAFSRNFYNPDSCTYRSITVDGAGSHVKRSG